MQFLDRLVKLNEELGEELARKETYLILLKEQLECLKTIANELPSSCRHSLPVNNGLGKAKAPSTSSSHPFDCSKGNSTSLALNEMLKKLNFSACTSANFKEMFRMDHRELDPDAPFYYLDEPSMSLIERICWTILRLADIFELSLRCPLYQTNQCYIICNEWLYQREPQKLLHCFLDLGLI